MFWFLAVFLHFRLPTRCFPVGILSSSRIQHRNAAFCLSLVLLSPPDSFSFLSIFIPIFLSLQLLRLEKNVWFLCLSCLLVFQPSIHPSIHPIFHYLLCVMHLLDAKAMKNFKRWALFSRNSKCRIVAELKTFSQNMWIYDRCSDGGLINAVPARGLQSSVCSEWEILFSQTPNLGIKWGGSITDEVLPLYLRQVTACCALSSLLNIFHTFFLNPHSNSGWEVQWPHPLNRWGDRGWEIYL